MPCSRFPRSVVSPSLSVAFCTHNLCIMRHRAFRLHQQALHSGSFVAPLAGLRKRQFTQGEIAALAGLSMPTVRLIERGGGDQTSLVKLLSALGLVIEGRIFPPERR